jgi:hypothetical protein
LTTFDAILMQSHSSSMTVTILIPMQRPNNPPMAEKKLTQVWLGKVSYSITVGLLK